MHLSFNFSESYPNGLADVVGYWTEGRIFGGVIVFARGLPVMAHQWGPCTAEPEKYPDRPPVRGHTFNIFMHTLWSNETYHVYWLS